MTDATFTTHGPSLSGGGLLDIFAALVACHRWAYAMQARYDRLGARGFRPGDAGLDDLMASLDGDVRNL